MRRSERTRTLVAGAVVLSMVLSVSGLLGATGATVRITSPRSGARVSGVITINASVKAERSVSYVILAVGEDRPQSSNSAPYTFELDTAELADGTHRIFVEAYDRYGLVASSSVITIHVRNGSAPAAPVVKESRPAQVAAKPAAGAAPRAATAPPVHSAARSSERVRVAGTPEAQTRPGAASPLAVGRGPVPPPAQSAAGPALAAQRPGPAPAPAVASLPSGIVGSTPPMPAQPAAAAVRGHLVVVDGRPVEFDVAPRILDGRVLVPFRSMFESQGARVAWDAKTRTARSLGARVNVAVPVGGAVARVNDRPVDMGAAAVIDAGRTLIPIRFFGAAIGAAVDWDSDARTAIVRMQDRRMVELRSDAE